MIAVNRTTEKVLSPMNKSVTDYLRSIGKVGGKKKSEAKTIASRENGKRGGRPRKKARKEQAK